MTLHRVLAELKTLDKRISSAIDEFTPTGVLINGKIKNSTSTVEKFNGDAKSGYQSVTDLIERRNKLKKALTKANSETTVEIAGIKMTIADAIDYKKVIQYKASLLARIRTNFMNTNSIYNRELEAIESKLEETIKAATGKSEKPDADLVATLTESYRKSHPVSVVDPLNITEVMKKLEEEVSNFNTEVDAVLSEVNAVTYVEV